MGPMYSASPCIHSAGTLNPFSGGLGEDELEWVYKSHFHSLVYFSVKCFKWCPEIPLECETGEKTDTQSLALWPYKGATDPCPSLCHVKWFLKFIGTVTNRGEVACGWVKWKWRLVMGLLPIVPGSQPCKMLCGKVSAP